jgi:hypothetical protein
MPRVRAAEAGDAPSLDRIGAGHHDDGHRPRCPLGNWCHVTTEGEDDDGFALNQLDGKTGQALGVPLSSAMLDDTFLAFDVAQVSQAQTEAWEIRNERAPGAT